MPKKSSTLYLIFLFSLFDREWKLESWQVSLNQHVKPLFFLVFIGLSVYPNISFNWKHSCFLIFLAGTWVNVASQANPKPWGDRNGQFYRADQRKNPEQRNFSQVLFVPFLFKYCMLGKWLKAGWNEFQGVHASFLFFIFLTGLFEM